MRHKPYGADGGVPLIAVCLGALAGAGLISWFARVAPPAVEFVSDFGIWSLKKIWKGVKWGVSKVVNYSGEKK